MAGINDLTINLTAQISIDDVTADTCCNLLHLYCNTHECNSKCTFYAELENQDYGYCNFKCTEVNRNSK